MADTLSVGRGGYLLGHGIEQMQEQVQERRAPLIAPAEQTPVLDASVVQSGGIGSPGYGMSMTSGTGFGGIAAAGLMNMAGEMGGIVPSGQLDNLKVDSVARAGGGGVKKLGSGEPTQIGPAPVQESPTNAPAQSPWADVTKQADGVAQDLAGGVKGLFGNEDGQGNMFQKGWQSIKGIFGGEPTGGAERVNLGASSSAAPANSFSSAFQSKPLLTPFFSGSVGPTQVDQAEW